MSKFPVAAFVGVVLALSRAPAGHAQRISLDLGDRTRSDVARDWVRQLTSAIREVDRRHMITVGVILLLNSTDLIDFSAGDLLTYGFILIGILLFLSGIGREDKKGVLGGTFFLAYGVVLTLMRTGAFYRDDDLGFGALFLALAAGNLVYYVFKSERTSNLTWGIIFSVVGGVFLMSYYGYINRWFLFDQIEHYWPVALVVVGILLIYKGFRHREEKVVNTT